MVLLRLLNFWISFKGESVVDLIIYCGTAVAGGGNHVAWFQVLLNLVLLSDKHDGIQRVSFPSNRVNIRSGQRIYSPSFHTSFCGTFPI